MANNPYAQYKQQSLSTLAQGELLVRLFDELSKQCRLAIMAIKERNLDRANDCLLKAQTIVNTLNHSLDLRYPVAKDLQNMYAFWSRQLVRANVRKNARLVIEILPLIKGMRDTFEQADKLSRSEQHVAQPKPIGGGKAV